MKLLIPLLLVSLTVPFFAFSQNRKGGSSGGLIGAGVGGSVGVVGNGELKKNITISLTGKDKDGSPIDVAMTGSGPTFRGDIVLGEVDSGDGNKIPVTGAIQYVVRPNGGGYSVDFSIGFAQPVVTSTTTRQPAAGGAGARPAPVRTSSIGFKESILDGTVKCTPGEGVEIFRSGKESSLVLTVTE